MAKGVSRKEAKGVSRKEAKEIKKQREKNIIPACFASFVFFLASLRET